MKAIKWIWATIITLTLTTIAMGQDWRYFTGNYGMNKAFIEGTGSTPDGQATTTLTLACNPRGGKGRIFVSLGLRDAHKMKSLDLAYFEGPDAPAQHKRLVTLKIKTERSEATFTLKASGAFSDMDNMKDFQFELGPAPARFIALLLKDAQKISVRVVDDRYKHSVVDTEFPAKGAQSALSESLRLGCK